ncbi:ABC transporter ATP-binding protein [Acidipropionibacterium jensenii]|uniref:ABC transporter ATP-binding protein n=1 Tax=Acidipropionibacterium jensenii TaxID=1749 RepID=UPI00214CC39E|nr:ATP-binding cassette domain-containing protein [Acidipropionibacterium jensenii]
MSSTTVGVAVQIDHLSHTFGSRRHGLHTAVDDLTLSVQAGECMGLLGPNGAGKTTTIRLINTLLPIQHGRIRIHGLDVSHQAMKVRRLIGYVPQQLSIEGALTGRENVEWFARLFDIPRSQRRRRVDQVLDMVDLQDAAGRLASTFSGGMVRRLELAQALVNQPAVLVLDEPTVGLDPVARDSVWARVRQMQAEHGMTVLITTHYMDEAEAMCDRIAMMTHGRLAALGTSEELRSHLGGRAGRPASLEDVFRYYARSGLDEDQGGIRNVRAGRRTANRVG